MKILAALCLLAIVAFPTSARADCANPPAPAGVMIYNVDHTIMQYCDGAEWIAMPGLGVSCAEGDTIVMTSSGWGCSSYASGGLSGPSGCANIGDECADGTVFAGYHPITQAHLFIPPTDQERPGSPGTFTMNWKNATGTDDISTDSTNDGQVNHANRGGAIGDFQAFQACEDLGFGGHSDWYLPSQVEAYYLWAVHEIIEAGGNITNFQNAYYWSSTEYGTNTAWRQSFSSGSQHFNTKTTGYRVRCVRR